MANEPNYQILRLGEGRINLCLEARHVGTDLAVTLTGGSAHIGATALSAPDSIKTFVIEAARHREGEIAAETAQMLAHGLNCRVAVACGIHYDRITAGEIATVRRLARQLAQKFINYLNCTQRRGNNMLTKADLEEFEHKLKSGAIDEQFKCADEQERGEILELLEKIMDVADLANEVATRLIFRGRLQ